MPCLCTICRFMRLLSPRKVTCVPVKGNRPQIAVRRVAGLTCEVSMSRRKVGGFAAGVLLAVGAAGLMMVLTGAVWQFVPVGLAILVVYGMSKAL